MAPVIKEGPYTWEGGRDTEGHRTWKVTWRVFCTSPQDGPATVMQTPGLYLPGSIWAIDNDLDIWAWCLPEMRVTPELEGEPNQWWKVEQTFSTRPPDFTRQRCNDFQIEDPLLEPPKISGGNKNDKVEAVFDRFGFPLLTSSFEQIKGAAVEFEEGMDVIRVEQNLSLLALTTSAPIRNTVNSLPIWGFPRRAVRLATVTWERKFYGSCYVYYTRVLEFECLVRYNPITGAMEGGWDRDVADIGTKVLAGSWDEDGDWVIADTVGGEPTNYLNPTHFIQAKGRDDKPMKNIFLNGRGVPAYTVVGTNQMFLAIENTTGDGLKAADKWIALRGVDDSTEWNAVQFFERGQLVNHASGGPAITYVATERVVGTEPGFDASWLLLGPTPYNFLDRGFYDNATAYVLGNIVRDGVHTGGGFRHIERYSEANFLLLGVPIVF